MPVIFREPRYERLRLPNEYEPVYEPQYESHQHRPRPLNQHTIYRGDDFGGHNIPFPHPRPPTPDPMYDDAFIDISLFPGATREEVLSGKRAPIRRRGNLALPKNFDLGSIESFRNNNAAISDTLSK